MECLVHIIALVLTLISPSFGQDAVDTSAITVAEALEAFEAGVAKEAELKELKAQKGALVELRGQHEEACSQAIENYVNAYRENLAAQRALRSLGEGVHPARPLKKLKTDLATIKTRTVQEMNGAKTVGRTSAEGLKNTSSDLQAVERKIAELRAELEGQPQEEVQVSGQGQDVLTQGMGGLITYDGFPDHPVDLYGSIDTDLDEALFGTPGEEGEEEAPEEVPFNPAFEGCPNYFDTKTAQK